MMDKGQSKLSIPYCFGETQLYWFIHKYSGLPIDIICELYLNKGMNVAMIKPQWLEWIGQTIYAAFPHGSVTVKYY